MKLLVALIFSFFAAEFAMAACTGPTAPSGKLEYRGGKYYWCGGSTWYDADGGDNGACSSVDVGKMMVAGSGAYVSFCNGSRWRFMQGGLAGSCSLKGLSAKMVSYELSSSKYLICDNSGVTAYYMVGNGASCSGTQYGGYCWYLGGFDDSCDTVCSTHGGNSDGTINYVGSGGTAAQCQNVLSALGAPGGGFQSRPANTIQGCHVYNSAYWYRNEDSTTTAGHDIYTQRVCSCAN